MATKVGLVGFKKSLGPVAGRTAKLSDILGGASSRNDEVSKLRNALSSTESDLKAAMESLSMANKEIDRLNCLVSSLEEELRSAREAKHSKKRKKAASSESAKE